MAKKKTEYPMVRILWVDSSHPYGAKWTLISNARDPELCECVSVGFLLNDTKEIKTLVQSLSLPIDATTQGSAILDIPACAVLSIQRLT